MSTVLDLVREGGIVMYPLTVLSVITVACSLERGAFWYGLLSTEQRIAHDVLATARYSLDDARDVADKVRHTPIGRYLLAPLSLHNPNPETFRLALEAAADKEFVKMRKGDKILETIVAISPLLGLLGTVTGLIATFDSLNVGGGGTGESATKAAGGIGEALISTAAGMIVAILALVAYRTFISFQGRQMDYFSDIGSELELIYRQVWYDSLVTDGGRSLRAMPPAIPESLTRDATY
jgi:biopolymer transport protein ExbB